VWFTLDNVDKTFRGGGATISKPVSTGSGSHITKIVGEGSDEK